MAQVAMKERGSPRTHLIVSNTDVAATVEDTLGSALDEHLGSVSNPEEVTNI